MRLSEITETRITAYHGTPGSFRAFRASKGDCPSKIGIWFASSKESASIIGQRAGQIRGEPSRVVTASLRLEQPAKFDTYADFLAAWRSAGSAGKLRRRLMRAGFDGVEITASDTDDAGERTDYAVFEPWQIDITNHG